MNDRQVFIGLIALGAVALAVTYFAGRGVGGVINEGVNSLIKDLTGGAAAGGEDTLGGVLARFREWISGDDAAIREMLEGAPPKPGEPEPTFDAMLEMLN